MCLWLCVCFEYMIINDMRNTVVLTHLLFPLPQLQHQAGSLSAAQVSLCANMN